MGILDKFGFKKSGFSSERVNLGENKPRFLKPTSKELKELKKAAGRRESDTPFGKKMAKAAKKESKKLPRKERKSFLEKAGQDISMLSDNLSVSLDIITGDPPVVQSSISPKKTKKRSKPVRAMTPEETPRTLKPSVLDDPLGGDFNF